jgi:hypothetical protein
MNITLITLILTLAILAPVIIANPHWLSYLRRRWVRLGVEADVANFQQPYFTDFLDLYFKHSSFRIF